MKKWTLYFQILVSLFLIGKSISEMTQLLDCDERGAVQETRQGREAQFYNFMNPSAHTLSSTFAIASMKLFGVNDFNSRIPAILFTMILLIVLGRFAYFHLSCL